MYIYIYYIICILCVHVLYNIMSHDITLVTLAALLRRPGNPETPEGTAKHSGGIATDCAQIIDIILGVLSHVISAGAHRGFQGVANIVRLASQLQIVAEPDEAHRFACFCTAGGKKPVSSGCVCQNI